MSRYLSSNGISMQHSDKPAKIINKTNILPNSLDQGKAVKDEVPLNPNLIPSINSKNDYCLSEGGVVIFKNDNLNNEKLISSPLKKKERIFNIKKEKRKRRNKEKHGANSKDNIIQTIITDFINFFLSFINLSIKKKIKKENRRKGEKNEINLEEIIFKIGFNIKSKIKVKDILDSTIESLLSFDEMKSQKYEKNICKNETSSSNVKSNLVNNTSTSNKQKIAILRAFFGSSLDSFFKTNVIALFKDLYLKTRKKVDLKKYGIQGIILRIPKNLQTFKRLKEKKKNKNKAKIMNDIIKIKFINPKKKNPKKRRVFFKIEKKE